MALFVIEHLEPRMWPWCVLEYKNCGHIIGKKDFLVTNTRSNKLRPLCTTPALVSTLHFHKPCILDPNASRELTPQEACLFDAFIFGGILGDDPPKQRTKDELASVPGERRHLGKAQMSTDTAVRVVWEILHGQRRSNLTFQDTITIPIREGEEIILPYRYRTQNGKPLLAPGLIYYLRHNKGF